MWKRAAQALAPREHEVYTISFSFFRDKLIILVPACLG
jgi:hypothetical protein